MKTPMIDNLISNINNVIVALLTSAIVGVCGTIYMTVRHDELISHMSDTVNALQKDVDNLKIKSASVDVKISSQEETIRRLQTDMEAIKYKLATIPDRNELNDTFNLFYERLSNKIEKRM